MTDWEPIRIQRDLYAEVTKIVTEKGFWINEQDFVRDAVREKIAKIQQQNGQKEA